MHLTLVDPTYSVWEHFLPCLRLLYTVGTGVKCIAIYIFIKDFVVDRQQIEQMGCNYVDNIYDGFKGTDIILVMNNHYKNNKFNTFEALKFANKPFLFFDGWNIFNQEELEKNIDCFYSSMGYMTNR